MGFSNTQGRRYWSSIGFMRIYILLDFDVTHNQASRSVILSSNPNLMHLFELWESYDMEHRFVWLFCVILVTNLDRTNHSNSDGGLA